MDAIRIVKKQNPKKVLAPTVKKHIDIVPQPIEDMGSFTKLLVAALLFSLTPMLFPQKSVAAEIEPVIINPLVFEAGDHTEFMRELKESAEEKSFKERHEQAVAKLQRQLKMNTALKQYLQSKRSPLADYTHVILQQNNWKKILALSNAESTMCRRYIEHLNNCWGVGGSDLWDMGDNLGEGVVAMNHFLNTAPKKSQVKYSQMNFEQMNGLYKQPPGDHWVYNNLQVYNELTALENSVK